MKKNTIPTVKIMKDKEWDSDVFICFIDDNENDFGYERIISLHPKISDAVGKNDKDKIKIITPYLESYYIEHKDDINIAKKEIENIWNVIHNKYFNEIEKIFGPLDFYNPKELKAALSIAKVGSLGDDNKSFQIWYKTSEEPAEVRRHFAHEILHFYYYEYLRKQGLFTLASDWDKAEIFNVVILGLPQFVNIIGKADAGYKQHEKYFSYFNNLWLQSKNIDEYLTKTISVQL